ncbi:hypothetical protein ACLB2K_074391 [Fragaria x ananassa]
MDKGKQLALPEELNPKVGRVIIPPSSDADPLSPPPSPPLHPEWHHASTFPTIPGSLRRRRIRISTLGPPGHSFFGMLFRGTMPKGENIDILVNPIQTQEILVDLGKEGKASRRIPQQNCLKLCMISGCEKVALKFGEAKE